MSELASLGLLLVPPVMRAVMPGFVKASLSSGFGPRVAFALSKDVQVRCLAGLVWRGACLLRLQGVSGSLLQSLELGAGSGSITWPVLG